MEHIPRKFTEVNFLKIVSVQGKSLLRIDYLLTFEVGMSTSNLESYCWTCKMLTAIIIVARVQPGTSKGITDLLLPQPSSVLKIVSGPSSLHSTLQIPSKWQAKARAVVYQKIEERQQEAAVTFVAFKIQRSCVRDYVRRRSRCTTEPIESVIETQLSRQITPRTKNGHAPPITQSWKD